jgi:hypothetical protein
MKKEITSKTQLLKILKGIPIKDDTQRNSIVCSLIGHSWICTAFFGYRYCGRCGDQLGDSLASIDPGVTRAVIVGHNCKVCRTNYKNCTWRDKLYAPDPFKKQT